MSGLFKTQLLLKIVRRNHHELAALLQPLVFRLQLFLYLRQFVLGDAVFAPGVIGGLHLHFAKRNHVRAGNDANFATGGGLSHLAKFFASVMVRSSYELFITS